MDHNTNHIECPACRADLPEYVAHRALQSLADVEKVEGYHYSDCSWISEQKSLLGEQSQCLARS